MHGNRGLKPPHFLSWGWFLYIYIFRCKVQEPFSSASRAWKRSRDISVTIVTTLATVSGFRFVISICTLYKYAIHKNRMSRVKSCSNKRISLNLTTGTQPWNKSWNYWPKQVAYCQYVSINASGEFSITIA